LEVTLDEISAGETAAATNATGTRPGDAERPATAFLSYARKDADEVERLQCELKLRGVRAWRDVTDLALGGYSAEEIARAIADESDALLLYLTPRCLASRFIWDIEVPTALRRREQDRDYGIVPIFRGVDTRELDRFCAGRGCPPLTDFNGAFIPERGVEESEATIGAALAAVARRALAATLRLRLRRVGADRTYTPRLCLRTFPYTPAVDSLDLDLDWLPYFADRTPSADEWRRALLPALRDVKDALSAAGTGRTLHLIVQARLPVALALGAAFPASAHFTLVVEGRHGAWSTAATDAAGQPLRRASYGGDGDARVALVETAISRKTARAVTESLPSLNLSFGHHLQFTPPEGPGDEAVKDGVQALAMARQIGRELKRLRDEEGVRHVHLFAACPAALAVLLGHQFNAATAITVYHTDAAGLYVPACTLNAPTNV
jgi:hypothetical protein